MKLELFILGLNRHGNLFFIFDSSSKVTLCTKLEIYENTHSRKQVAKVTKTSGNC